MAAAANQASSPSLAPSTNFWPNSVCTHTNLPESASSRSPCEKVVNSSSNHVCRATIVCLTHIVSRHLEPIEISWCQAEQPWQQTGRVVDDQPIGRERDRLLVWRSPEALSTLLVVDLSAVMRQGHQRVLPGVSPVICPLHDAMSGADKDGDAPGTDGLAQPCRVHVIAWKDKGETGAAQHTHR